MPIQLRVLLFLTASLLLPCACGGGGGGGGGGDEEFSFSDIVGSWLGPTGTATVAGGFSQAAGPTGMVVDASGNAVAAGASIREGTLSITSTSRGIYKFTGTGASLGRTFMLIMSPDKNHLLWVGGSLSFGAWERNATNFAPPYTDAQIRNATWTGVAAEATAAFDPLDPEVISVTIDGTGSFASGPSTTNLTPLTIADAGKGHYLGDFIDPGPPTEMGNLVVLITPDKNFIAVFSCLAGGAFPDDCSYAALSR